MAALSCAVIGGAAFVLAVASAQSGAKPRPSQKGEALARLFDAQREAQATHPGWESQRVPFHQSRRWARVRKPPAGMYEIETPFPSAYYDVSAAAWERWRRGWLTQVYVGALTQEPAQGILIVLERPYPLRVSLVPNSREFDAPDRARETVYKAPKASGKLRITGYRGDSLFLASARGDRWSFDVHRKALVPRPR